MIWDHINQEKLLANIFEPVINARRQEPIDYFLPYLTDIDPKSPEYQEPWRLFSPQDPASHQVFLTIAQEISKKFHQVNHGGDALTALSQTLTTLMSLAPSLEWIDEMEEIFKTDHPDQYIGSALCKTNGYYAREKIAEFRKDLPRALRSVFINQKERLNEPLLIDFARRSIKKSLGGFIYRVCQDLSMSMRPRKIIMSEIVKHIGSSFDDFLNLPSTSQSMLLLELAAMSFAPEKDPELLTILSHPQCDAQTLIKNLKRDILNQSKPTTASQQVWFAGRPGLSPSQQIDEFKDRIDELVRALERCAAPFVQAKTIQNQIKPLLDQSLPKSIKKM